MNRQIPARAALRILFCCIWMWTGAAMRAAEAPAPQASAPVETKTAPAAGEKDVIVAKAPMVFEAEDGGIHGQLGVASEILGTDTSSELVFTITSDPVHGRVGLAGGGEEADFLRTRARI